MHSLLIATVFSIAEILSEYYRKATVNRYKMQYERGYVIWIINMLPVLHLHLMFLCFLISILSTL